MKILPFMVALGVEGRGDDGLYVSTDRAKH
jgi:hypothetical protein